MLPREWGGWGGGGGGKATLLFRDIQTTLLTPVRGDLTLPKAVYRDRRTDPFHTQPGNN